MPHSSLKSQEKKTRKKVTNRKDPQMEKKASQPTPYELLGPLGEGGETAQFRVAHRGQKEALGVQSLQDWDVGSDLPLGDTKALERIRQLQDAIQEPEFLGFFRGIRNTSTLPLALLHKY